MEPEVLNPGEGPFASRTRVGRSVFTDENLDLLAHVLDDWFRIPGTPIRFGIDGLIGLVPFAGDIFAGLASSIIVMAAWFRGVPYVTLARMVVNIAIDVLVGMVPLVGDAFDIAWKANAAITSCSPAICASRTATPGRTTFSFSASRCCCL
jgi:hypothetical protein